MKLLGKLKRNSKNKEDALSEQKKITVHPNTSKYKNMTRNN